MIAWYWVILIVWAVALAAFVLGWLMHMWCYAAYNDDEKHGRQEWQQAQTRIRDLHDITSEADNDPNKLK